MVQSGNLHSGRLTDPGCPYHYKTFPRERVAWILNRAKKWIGNEESCGGLRAHINCTDADVFVELIKTAHLQIFAEEVKKNPRYTIESTWKIGLWHEGIMIVGREFYIKRQQLQESHTHTYTRSSHFPFFGECKSTEIAIPRISMEIYMCFSVGLFRVSLESAPDSSSTTSITVSSGW